LIDGRTAPAARTLAWTLFSLVALAACGDDATPRRPDVPTCPDVATAPGTLAARAARFEAIIPEWHVRPGQDLLHSALLAGDLQTFEHVDISDNTGFWTAIYTASQAFRYRVTGDPEALGSLKRTLRGQRDLLRITGVEGLFARSYIDPALPGMPTRQALEDHYPDCDLSVSHCKRWNWVDEGPYAGRIFKSDVSKDEYSGHMFTMGVLWELIDDPEVRDVVREVSGAVARHLMTNSLEIHDIDGVVTTFGHMHPLALDDLPGFNAALTLSWFRVAIAATGDRDIESYYENCLLHHDKTACPDPAIPTHSPHPEYLSTMGLNLGCKTNWNNHNMAQLSMYNLLRHERDREARESIERAYVEQMWGSNDIYPMRDQHNTLFTFFWEVNRPRGTEFPRKELNDAVCVLKRFPDLKYEHAVDTTQYPQTCTDRFDRPMTNVVIPLERREIDNYHWANNPYRMQVVEEQRNHIESPEDYLLAYWFGRYFGLLGPEL
jgi:hypothetical protein